MTNAYVVAGAAGMLGTALQSAIEQRGERLFAPAESAFDITDPNAVSRVIAEFADSLADDERGIVLNAAAYTNVEAAETDPEAAYLVNASGPAFLAQAALDSGIRLLHVSTDFVFDGEKDTPYSESDRPRPLSVYGASKLAGESEVTTRLPEALIVRTAWVFSTIGANFPLKILHAARRHGSLRVVDDERGSPTYTKDLAAGILALLDASATGVYHLAGAGECSRYEFAQALLAAVGLHDVEVTPTRASEFASAVSRPANSVLDCSRAAQLGVVMPSWEDALARWAVDLAVDERTA